MGFVFGEGLRQANGKEKIKLVVCFVFIYGLSFYLVRFDPQSTIYRYYHPSPGQIIAFYGLSRDLESCLFLDYTVSQQEVEKRTYFPFEECHSDLCGSVDLYQLDSFFPRKAFIWLFGNPIDGRGRLHFKYFLREIEKSKQKNPSPALGNGHSLTN